MKIAWLTMYAGLVERGAEVLTAEVTKRLAKQHDIIVFQGGKKSVGYPFHTIPIAHVQNTDVEHSLVDRLLRFLYYDPHARQVRAFSNACLKELADSKWDIVIPTDGGWETTMIRNFTRRQSSKCVAIGMAGRGYDDWWNLKQGPDLFISLSPEALMWARRVNHNVPVVCIPPGVDMSVFKPAGKRLELKLPRPVILCVAALVPYKRVDLAIQAVSQLSDGSLLIVGGGPQEKKLRALGEKLLPGRFAIRQYPHEEMPKVFRSCDLFTLPSRPSEAFGIAYLEAMASGLGVVAPNDKNRKVLVGKAGITTDVEHIFFYAQALRDVLNGRYREEAINQVSAYTWDAIAKRYEEALNTCVQV